VNRSRECAPLAGMRTRINYKSRPLRRGPQAILTQPCQGMEDGGPIRHGLLDELLRSKDRFRNHSINAFGPVHGLCDMIVDSHARNDVGLLACEISFVMRSIVSRTAIFIASSRSGLRPITTQCVGVSGRGHRSLISSRTMN
jgi:hypothetical protein